MPQKTHPKDLGPLVPLGDLSGRRGRKLEDSVANVTDSVQLVHVKVHPQLVSGALVADNLFDGQVIMNECRVECHVD